MAKKGKTLNVEIPRYFEPLLQPNLRYRGVFGGRSSSKSHTTAEWVIAMCVGNPGYRVLCGREIQKSLNQSVKQLLADKIKKFGLEKHFDIQQSVIKTPGNGMIMFAGLQAHTSDSIKSLEGVDLAWIEEASTVSQYSLDILRPTIRKPGSSIFFTYNPRFPTDPVDKFLRGGNPPPDSAIVQANYMDNPHLPDLILQEAEYDKKRDFDKYRHVWLGEYVRQSEANVFKNWRSEYFETPEDARFLFGADWGFSKDPTTLVRAFIGRWEDGKAINDPKGRCLFVDYEAYEVGCTIEKTPVLFDTIPEARNWLVRADNARPETIDYMQRNGFPRIVSASKGANSIIDGIEFLKSYDIIVHERCKHMQDELMYYKYKQDKLTEEILPQLEGGNDHCLDSLRYAVELVRKATRHSGNVATFAPIIPNETQPIIKPAANNNNLIIGCKMF